MFSRNTQLTNRRQKTAGKKPTTTESNDMSAWGLTEREEDEERGGKVR
jgi:hypothetical protein